MNSNTFDQHIKDALENINEPLQPGDWSLFEQRLNQTEDTLNQFDSKVRSGLNKVEMPYQPADWTKMASQLDRSDQIRRRMWMYKFAEAAVFLLLLASIHTFVTNNQYEDTNTSTQAGVNTNTKPDSGSQQRKSKQNGQSNNPSITDQILSNVAAIAASLGSGENTVEPNNTYNNNIIDNILTAEDLAAGTSILDGSRFLNQHGVINIADMKKLPAIPNEPIAFLDNQNLNFPQYPLIKKVLTRSPLYFASFASLQQDKVTPNANGKNHQGQGMGMKVGYRKGKWGIESGVAYSTKSYAPKKQIEIYAGNVSNGFYGNYTEEANADIISVPLKGTRQIAKWRRSSIHAMAGVSANIAIQKEYRNKEVYYPGLQPQGSGNNTNPPSTTTRRTANGVLENGNFSENTYVTADLGFRLEHQINQRYTAFVEPTLQRAISNKGFGPKDTRVNSIVVQAGVLSRI